VVVLVFHAPSLAYFVEDLRGWFSRATIEVDAFAVGLLACFLLGGLSIDLCDGSDTGKIDLYWSHVDRTHASDIYASVAKFWGCV
jgi:hypothetical protein